MNKNEFSNQMFQLKPFLSVLFILLSLFGLVFLKMEERRMSYVILKSTREFKQIKQDLKQKKIQLAKYSKPQYIESIAKEKLTLKRIKQQQIIHLNPHNKISFVEKVLTR